MPESVMTLFPLMLNSFEAMKLPLKAALAFNQAQMQSVAAVAVFTVSGRTAQLLAKNRPACPIVALSSNLTALRRCCLYHGVMPRKAKTPEDFKEAVTVASRICIEAGVAELGQRIIVLAGHPFDVPGNTNGLVVMTLD